MKRMFAVICALIVVFSGYTVADAQTIDELKALIKTLTEQIALLEQQIAAKKAGKTVLCPALTRALSVGVSGADVTSLQQFLAADSAVYPEGTASGYFGPLTEQAVQRWQAKYNVVTSGTPATTGYGAVGPMTRSAIARVCDTMSKRACVVGTTAIPHGENRTFYPTNAVPFGATCNPLIRTCNDGVLSGDPLYTFSACAPATTGQSCLLPDGTPIAHGNSPLLYKTSMVLFGQTCEPFGATRTCNNGALSGNAEYRFPVCSVPSAGPCVVTASSTASTTIAHGAQKEFYSVENAPYTASCNDYKQLRVCTDGHISGGAAYKYASCKVIAARTCTLDNVTIAHGGKFTFFSARSNATCANVSLERTCTDGTLSGIGTFQYAVCAPAGQRWCTLDNKYTAHNATSTYYSQQTVPFGNACSQFSIQRGCVDGTLNGSSAYGFAMCASSEPASCTLDGKTIAHNTSDVFYMLTKPPAGESCAAYQQTRYCNDGFLSGSSNFSFKSCSI